MRFIKPLLFTLGYTFLLFALPLIIFLKSSSENSSALFIYFAIVVFATIGFILFLNLFKNDAPKAPKMNKELEEKLENIEIQNAAIAFSLSEVKKALKGKNNMQ